MTDDISVLCACLALDDLKCVPARRAVQQCAGLNQARFDAACHSLTKAGLLVQREDHISLTPQGHDVAAAFRDVLADHAPT